jgi:DNA-binding MarR family transcriptional regulator
LEANRENKGRERLIDEIVGIAQPIHEYTMIAHSDAWTRVTLTMPQFKVLVAAAVHGRIDSPYLGRRLGMLPSTLTRIVDRLVERDLVRRRVDPRDRRVVYLEATEDGQRLVRDLTASALPSAMSQALHDVSAEDLATLRQGLDILANAVGRVQRPTSDR